MSDLPQFIRRVGLLVSKGTSAVDLSQFRIKFSTVQSDFETPNSAAIRVYNLDPNTVNQLRGGEFTTVSLQAGYEGGNYGAIFQGSIKQYKIGRESATDTYVDILAADGDIAYNQATMNTNVSAAGTSALQQAQLAAGSMGLTLHPETVKMLAAFGGTMPRGKVQYGMARDYLRNVSQLTSSSWSIQNGVVQIIPLTGYLPGEAVLLSELTGVIGIPEATDEGIRITCLINPRLTIGGTVQIANALINQTLFQNPLNAPIPYTQWAGLQYIASTANDGLYRVYVVEYEGDTRGHPWYSHVTALAIDPSSNQVIIKPD